MNLVEGLNLELKREYQQDVLKTVIAFANTKGGDLYIGVEDDGTVVGVEHTDDIILKLTNAIRDSVKPDITPFTRCEIKTIDDKDVIVCHIQRGTSLPYYINRKGMRPEGVFIRQGASSVPASEVAIINMLKNTSGDNFEETRSLNQLLSFVTLEKEFLEASIEFGPAQVKTLHLVNEDELYTNLGRLLSEDCQHTIKVAVFEGKGKTQFKDRYEFTGSLLKQMKEVFAYIDRYNRTSSVFEGLTRVDKREYPIEAIREALLNAIVHKDYAYSSSTLINIFDDRIEFITIGGLVKGISINDILMGVSVLRNRHLANVLYRLKWIEAYGTGIYKINESYNSFGVTAKIETSDNAFKITLPNTMIIETVEESHTPYTTREEDVLEIFNTKDEIKRKDVEEALGISQPMAVNLLRRLLDKSAIVKLGQGKNTVYRLK